MAITPVSDGRSLLENPQLASRNFWQTVRDPGLGGAEVVCPGAPYAFGELSWRQGNPAPALGEHGAEVLSEAGYGPEEIEQLAREGIVHVP